MSADAMQNSSGKIAIIGMAGRLPGARDVYEFWRNLEQGVESIRFFTKNELLAMGEDPTLLDDPNYVAANGCLEGIELFDAAFFGFTPREAEITDPQHRIFLECVWNALEDSGYDCSAYDGRIGVFAGAGPSSYLIHNLLARPDVTQSVDRFNLLMGNNKDYVPTRASYKLNLTGPSINVNTACSSSLTAVHLACQSLLDYQCDIAIAGGVGIQTPQLGYIYEENAILSPDGRCRAFDAAAQGTVSGNGAAIVVLKRLDEALEDRDAIRAVILGSAINNDGAAKVGFTAPSVEGQTEVIAEALAVAQVSPATIQYIETHGTGTSIGAPIEIAALRAAFQEAGDKGAFCAIGSVKTNVGHLDEAAGGAGLIKTALALQHGVIPPSLHFQTPNPKIDFEHGPFYVADKRIEWNTNGAPRRAGVSSFGIGGTNVHIVLEEPPAADNAPSKRPWHLLKLSARSQTALANYAQSLAEHFDQHPATDVSDASYTLQVGRKEFSHRRAVIVKDARDAANTLRGQDPRRVLHGEAPASERPVAFLFSGQGSQYANMGLDLYQSEDVFRDAVDQCAQLLRPHLKADLRAALYPEVFASPDTLDLNQTAWAQPALFTVSYALMQLWASWGVEAKCAVGHSIGEYAAACWARVFTLEDALSTVALRGRLMQGAAPGAMLAVSLPEAEAGAYLSDGLCIAAVNAPQQCVVAGGEDEIQRLQARLENAGRQCVRLRTSHAFHSSSMDPILDAFRDHLQTVTLHEPQRRFISNLTGDWITSQQATDPGYWAAHLRNPVRFADAARLLCQDERCALLELGPGNTLGGLAMLSDECEERIYASSLRRVNDAPPDSLALHQSLGRLWTAGVKVDWQGCQRQQMRGRIPLPTYPFERQRFWIDAPAKTAQPQTAAPAKTARQPFAQWFYTPVWRPSPPQPPSPSPGQYAIFANDSAPVHRLIEQLRSSGAAPVCVRRGDAWAQISEFEYSICPGQPAHYDQLLATLNERNLPPDRIVYAWAMNNGDADAAMVCPAWLTQALGRLSGAKPIDVIYLSQNLFCIQGEACAAPEQALMLGAVMTAPLEYESISCRLIDLGGAHDAPFLLNETAQSAESVVAYRGGQRWVKSVEAAPPRASGNGVQIHQDGAYLITGGLGGVGLALAERLAQNGAGAVALISRRGAPVNSSEIHAIEKHGTKVIAYAADVSDAARLKSIIADLRAQTGEVRGVIHAAGVADGEMMQRRSRQSLLAALSAKVGGAKALNEALDLARLDFCVLCSALSADLGSIGQVSYIAANSFLNAFAQQKRAAGANVAAVHWDAWREVGMAAASRAGAKPDAFFQPLEINNASIIAYAAVVNAGEDWALNEHRIAGRAIAPGTAYLEWVREAFQCQARCAAFAYRDVYFLNPLIVETRREVRVVFHAQRAPCEFCVISCEVGGDAWTTHAQGSIEILNGPPASRQTLDGRQPPETHVPSRLDARMQQFGPHWQCMEWVKETRGGALAKLRLPDEFANELNAQPLHPALLDVATGFCVLRDGFGEGLPFSYKQVRVYAPLTQTLYSQARTTKNDGDEMAFDIQLFDEKGSLIIEIDEYASKRVQKQTSAYQQLQAKPNAAENYQLDVAAPGELKTLTLRPSPRRAPAEGEVELCVEAAGLNFKEVMYAYGMFDEAEGFKLPLGLECAATVTAVGPGVTSLQVGDRVAAFAAECFQRYVTVAADRAVKLPAGLSFEQGATIPAAFLTACYALRTLAQLKQGERVLIHAAAGGVGMAAVAVAQQIGATIFATAGSDEKRAYLKSLGVDYVMNSRTLDFADQVRGFTQGEGVNVALNSLSGEFAQASLELLAPFGRFLEIGVRDIYNNAQMGLAPFQKCLSYFAVGVGPETPGFTGLFQDLMNEFESGALKPLPHKAYPAEQARDAFAFMAKAKHIGKLVIQFDDVGAVAFDAHSTPRTRTQPWDALIEDFAPDDARSPRPRDEAIALGLSNREGQDAFEYALKANVAELIVSTTDFHQRLNLDRTIRGALGDGGPAAGSPTNGGAERSPLETVEAIWKDCLGVRAVAAADNFYELGGDSLLAAQILTRLRKALRVSVSLSAFLEAPTYGALCALVQPAQDGAAMDADGDDEMEEGEI